LTQTIWTRVEEARRRWDVLRHPFYRRWSAGELSAEEVARYSGQYRHAVEAIAVMSEAIADAAHEDADLRGHAAEERDHVGLWDGFVEAVDGDPGDPATPETRECVRAWTALSTDGQGVDVLATVARLYAVESGQPAISRTKREGLTERYGFAEGPATAYFRLHERRDAEHAAEMRSVVESLSRPEDEDRVVAAAEAALRANWRLLDGV
jgi:pyrroloquinoline-quinone synthase